MYKLCICDDKEKCRDFVSSEIEKFFSASGETYELDQFASGDEFLFHLKPGYYDIVFFDIEMDGTDGLETARRLRRIDSNVVIVFTSAIKEAVFDGFTAEPLTFLTKPLQSGQMQDALKRALMQVQRTQKQKFVYTVNKTTNVLPVRDIVYIESKGRVLEVVTLGERISFYGRLDTAQANPALDGFLRCHQSYLVNPDYIMEISGSEILLTTRQTVPIRRGSAKELRLEFMKYLDSLENSAP